MVRIFCTCQAILRYVKLRKTEFVYIFKILNISYRFFQKVTCYLSQKEQQKTAENTVQEIQAP